jgi:2-(1,2-epoxy-1,2-dihydrophenyl)acetyl-CoA isomerase
MSELVLTSRVEQITTLTLNRPERHNSLTPEFLEAILASLTEALSDRGLRVLILQANGRSFSTGGDVLGFYQNLDEVQSYAETTVDLLNQVILELIDCPVPVVTAVHGIVTGGSLGFVLASDLVILTPQASFRPYYSEIGFSPDGGWTAILPDLIGAKRTAQILMWNQAISAESAVAWGLASRVVAADDLSTEIADSAREICSMAPGSIASTKKLLRARLNEIQGRLELEKERFVEQIGSQEAARGMRGFLRIG